MFPPTSTVVAVGSHRKPGGKVRSYSRRVRAQNREVKERKPKAETWPPPKRPASPGNVLWDD